MLKVLLINTFLVFKGQSLNSKLFHYNSCEKVKVSYILNQDQGNTKVSVNVDGGKSPYKYIFYNISGDLMTEDFDNNSLSNLQKGIYYCMVTDKDKCRKTIEIEIQ
jgi:hypothetical protein